MGQATTIKERLFSDDTQSVYAILDGASIPDLQTRLYEQRPEYVCLYRGALEPDIAMVAPYLVHLQIKADFTEWVLGEGFGKHWGVFALSSSDLRALRQHFRKLLTVYDPDMKPVLFRYYDPRVLKVYLPTCNTEELKAVFGPVSTFLLEDDEMKQMLSFRFLAGQLKQAQLSISND